MWLNLMHYRKSFWGGYDSQAQGDVFFISPEGASNPEAELRATLKAFEKDEVIHGEYAQCRFPARFRWLKEQSATRAHSFPMHLCPTFEDYKKLLDAKSVSLLFSSYFLNNPASAFGHIFLRINRSGKEVDPERSELLDHGVSYAAVVTQENAILYAIYGLFGLFKGEFSKVPYFYKIREYNDFETRDLWEYRLTLNQDQVDILVAHLWELGSTHFKYYYLTQNCAYHIITALQVAIPDIDLVGKMPTVSIPVDGLKALTSFPSLFKEVRFRPSLRTRWKDRLETLTFVEKEALKRVTLAKNDIPPSLTEQEKIHVYDAALDYVDLQHYKELVLSPESAVATEKHKLLAERSQIPIASAEATVVKPSDPPHNGHDTMRVGIGHGSNAVSPFSEVNVRFALHDLLDPSTGYPTYSQIEFFNLQGRFAWNSNRFSSEELTLFQVISLSPIDAFHAPMSWKAKIAGFRVHDGSCDSCFAGGVEVGAGWTAELTSQAALFLTADVELSASGDYFQNFLRLGVGPSLGARIQLSPSLIGLFSTGYRHRFFSAAPDALTARGEIRWALENRFALSLRGVRWPQTWESSINGYFYF